MRCGDPDYMRLPIVFDLASFLGFISMRMIKYSYYYYGVIFYVMLIT